MTVGGALLAAFAFVASDQFSAIKIHKLETRIGDLEREMTELKLYADRIQASRRVAQVNVTDRRPGDANGPVTVLRWQQIGPTGELGPPEIVEVRGTQVYLEALVLKFQYDLIGNAEKDRETNLALFRRAFGDYQAPMTGYPLDQTAPTFAQASPGEYALQKKIWDRFWSFTTDAALAKEYGVRVAQFEAPSVQMEPGQVWEVTLDVAGGLNLKLLSQDEAVANQPPMQLSAVETTVQP
jgi:hypothetical protein